MDAMQEWLRRAVPFLPAVVTAALAIGILVVAQRILQHRAMTLRRSQLRYQVVMIGPSLVGLVAVVLVLPVEGPTRMLLLSLLGILFRATLALASTTLIGNALAGLMLQTVDHFRIGDFIRVGKNSDASRSAGRSTPRFRRNTAT